MKNHLGHMPIEFLEEDHSQKRLGKLYFPNGENLSKPQSEGNNSYFIELKDLYKNISKFTVEDKQILSLGLIGIIAKGKAVKYPGYTIEKFQRGNKEIEEKVPIQPTKTDFLVITQDNPIPEDYIGRTSRSALLYHCENNINLTVRGIEQVLNGLKFNDNIRKDKECVDAFEKGIPIFFNHDLNHIMSTYAIKNINPAILEWYLEGNNLTGNIRRVD